MRSSLNYNVLGDLKYIHKLTLELFFVIELRVRTNSKYGITANDAEGNTFYNFNLTFMRSKTNNLVRLV